MTDAEGDRPRTWVPVAAAGAVAAVVVIVAVAWTGLGARPSDVEAAAIEACEAAFARTNAPAIVGGEVYEPNEFRDYYAVVETHGEVPVALAEVAQEQLESWDRLAEQYEADGDGGIVVVWRLADDTYRQCALPVQGGNVDGSQARVSPLSVASEDE